MLATAACLGSAIAAYGKSTDAHALYPDSCPVGRDISSGTPVPTRLCLPRWEPAYNMPLSTITVPCNSTGYYDPTVAAKYGIAVLGWS